MSSEQPPLYGIGDKIKIVKYGHPIWQNKHSGEPKMKLPLIAEDENMWWFDLQSKLVGKVDIVCGMTTTQGVHRYSLQKYGSWYSEEQMEMVSQNPNI